jgi:hypothetical protein
MRPRVEHGEQQRRRDLVGEIPRDGELAPGPRGRGRVVEDQRILLAQLHVAAPGELHAQHARHVAIAFDRDHPPLRHGVGESRGQRAEAAADLDDPLVGRPDGRAHDRRVHVLGDEEVLSPRLLGEQAVLAQQRPRVGMLRHRLMLPAAAGSRRR